MSTLCFFSVVVAAALCLAAGSPIPEDENLFISFAVTTESPSLKNLVQVHRNLSSVCESMIPAHGNSEPQNSASPYGVAPSVTKVAPGGTVAVSFSGAQFRGVYLQARTAQGEPVGHFLPSADDHVILSSCGKGHDNAVTYISYEPTSNFAFQWVAPEDPTSVTFRATFVESFSKFWVGVESGPVAVKN